MVGLAAEGRIAGRLGAVAVGGGLPAGAMAAAELLVAQGVTGLVSFGLAGGLDPTLPPGTIVRPARVMDRDEVFLTSGPATHDLLLAHDQVIASAAAKAAWFRATGAVAVDLESGAVARVAARHRLPFAVLRVICDPALAELPPAALVALDGGGAIGVLRVIGSVLRSPVQLLALLALARDAGRARAALVAAARNFLADFNAPPA